MNLKYFITGFLLMTLFFAACKKKVVPPDAINLGKEYYPLQVGKYIIYDVDSLVYRDFDKDSVMSHMQIMHKITDSFYDLQNRLSYIYEIYKRIDSADAWHFVNVNYATITDINVEVQDNKSRMIKFAFPVRDNYFWDGNKYVDPLDLEWMQVWRLKYFDFEKPYATTQQTFDKTVTVNYIYNNTTYKIQNDTINGSYYSFVTFKEVYAKNVGMIYKYQVYFKRDNSVDPSATRTGFRTLYTIKEHN